MSSLSQLQYPDWGLRVVDQSADERSAEVVSQHSEAFAGRLTYLRMREHGLSRARNAGIDTADGEIVAFFDDDCTAAEDWLARVAEAFARFPSADVVFGSTVAAPHDRTVESIPEGIVETERLLHGRLACLSQFGIGAAMSLRRECVARVGYFDPVLGAGSGVFNSAEDTDFVYRVLSSGRDVLLTPTIVVIHHGARAYADGAFAKLTHDALRARAACDLKLARRGELVGAAAIARGLLFCARHVDLLRLITLRRPNNLFWLLAYVGGLAAGARLATDPQTQHFVSRRAPAASWSDRATLLVWSLSDYAPAIPLDV